MIRIKETNSERTYFIQRIAKANNMTAEVFANQVLVNDNALDMVEMSYQTFVGKYYNNDVVLPDGTMMVLNDNSKYIKLPSCALTWFSQDSMDSSKILKCTSLELENVSKYLGRHACGSGYFNMAGRTILYDASWRIVEITIDQIAKKFGVNPKQIRIKE